MDKLKKVFSPGSSKDDEVLYGDEGTRRASAAAASSERDTAKLYTSPDAEKEHGVLRQILNPGGNKYDDVAHGTTASTEKPDPSQVPSSEKDNTVAQQILNPGGDKYDPQRFGPPGENTSARSHPHIAATDTLETNPGEKKHEHSVLRQILNPGGKKYDNEAYGNTAHVVGDSSTTGSTSQSQSAATQAPRDQTVPSATGTTLPLHHPKDAGLGSASPASDLSIKSGKEGPYARANAELTGSQNTTGGPSHLGRDAAVAGTGVAGYEAAKHHPQEAESSRSSQPVDKTRTTHASPLSSNPTNSSSIDTARQPENDSHLGRDAAVGAGVAGGAAAYGAHKHETDHDKYKEQTSKSTPAYQSEATSSNVAGGSSYANQPTTSSAYTGGNTSSTTASREPTTSSHLGRDAALGAGAGAAGGAALYGAHHNARDKDEFGRPVQSTQGQTSSGNALSSGGSNPSHYGTGNTLSGSNAPSSTGATGNSHLGRDAAVLGGTGLAGGAAAHELGNRHNEPSQTGTSGLSQPAHNTTSSYAGGSGDPASSDGSILNRPHPLAGGATADSTTSTMFGGPGYDRERGVHQPGQGIDTSSGGPATSTTGAGFGTSSGGPLASTSGAVGGYGTSEPHLTSTAEKLDPHVHVPGEFPSEDGAAGTTFGSSTAPSTGAGTNNLTSGYGSSSTPGHSESTRGTTVGDDQNRHTGRDLAAGAAAGAGAGALASGISSHGSSTQKPSDYTNTSGSRTADTYPTTGQTATGTSASGLTSSQSPATHGSTSASHPTTTGAAAGSHGPSTSHASTTNTGSEPHYATVGHGTSDGKPHHHTAHFLGGIGGPMTGATLGGRDLGEGPSEDDLTKGDHSKAEKHQGGIFTSHHAKAAGAGDAGAAGIGAYEASNQRRGDTGPASKTIGPHDSNLANVVDPRVKPDPSKMKDQPTAGQVSSEHDHHHGHSSDAKHHNKLQKARPEEVEAEHSEKKPSLIHRILHPGEHKKEKEAEQLAGSSAAAGGANHPAGTEGATSQATDAEGRVIEPHTGLPMNVDKYGTGAGGTDGASNIAGLHQTDPAVAGPDWEAVRKANTPY